MSIFSFSGLSHSQVTVCLSFLQYSSSPFVVPLIFNIRVFSYMWHATVARDLLQQQTCVFWPSKESMMHSCSQFALLLPLFTLHKGPKNRSRSEGASFSFFSCHDWLLVTGEASEPVDLKNLSSLEHKHSLWHFMHLKKKWDGELKRSECIHGESKLEHTSRWHLVPNNSPGINPATVHHWCTQGTQHGNHLYPWCLLAINHGYFIYINLALVNWISKKQATIETSVFRAESVAMK